MADANGYTIPRWFAWIIGLAITVYGLLAVPWANTVASSLRTLENSVVVIEVKLDSITETRGEIRAVAAVNASRSIENDKAIDILAAQVRSLTTQVESIDHQLKDRKPQ